MESKVKVSTVLLRVKLKSGEVKFFPWYRMRFYSKDGFFSVYDNDNAELLRFRAPIENVEYYERVEENNGK